MFKFGLNSTSSWYHVKYIWANYVLLKPGVYTPTLKKHQVVRDLKKFENHCSKAYRKPSRALNCSRFACFILFQTGNNRKQLNCRLKRCGVKNQNRRQKVLSGGLNFRKWTWHTENLIKDLLICSVSYLHLERLSPTNAYRGDWTGLNFAYAVIIEIRIKK